MSLIVLYVKLGSDNKTYIKILFVFYLLPTPNIVNLRLTESMLCYNSFNITMKCPTIELKVKDTI